MYRIWINRDVDLAVVSCGGVGTTFLIKYFGLYKRTNHPHDADGIKHQPIPPITLSDKIKYIYVFGEPQSAIISLFRRGHHHSQSKKLQSSRAKPMMPIPKETTLREYVAEGVDRFCFREHFYNWYDTFLPATPTMFVRYETLFDHVDELLEFAEIPTRYRHTFPERRARTSHYGYDDPEIRSGLDDMYGNFAEELLQLADVEVRVNTQRSSGLVGYMVRPYPRLLVKQASYKCANILKRHSPSVYTALRRLNDRVISQTHRHF